LKKLENRKQKSEDYKNAVIQAQILNIWLISDFLISDFSYLCLVKEQ